MASCIPDMEELVQRAKETFELKFGQLPDKGAFAPGRVNLIGEHTDYNDGYVLPMAIQMVTVVVGKKTDGSLCRVLTCADVGTNNYVEFPVPRKSVPLVPGDIHWANYVMGVVAYYVGPVYPFDAVIVSSVPFGGGVSSSASLQVAIYALLDEFNDSQEFTSKPDIARTCMEAEHDFVGLPGGIMDQLISLTAKKYHSILLDCRSLESKEIAMTDESVSVLLTNSNVSHDLIHTEYPKRTEQCKEAAKILGVDSLRDVTMEHLEERKQQLNRVLYKRACHVVSEIERTVQAADALVHKDYKTFGKLMKDSHNSLRNDYDVSCDELNELVEAALEVDGVYGSRMTGGGFGGCTVTLVKTSHVTQTINNIKRKYRGHATFYLCKPSEGARGIRL